MILVYPNNTALKERPAEYSEVCKRTGCVPVMLAFGNVMTPAETIGKAVEMAESLGLPLVPAIAPPIERGPKLLRNQAAWRDYWGSVLKVVTALADSPYAEFSGVLVDQECWDVRTHGTHPVAGRTNDLAALLIASLGCPVWFYRLGDQQSYHFSTYLIDQPVLEDFRLPVSVRCYEPTENNRLDIGRVVGDPRYIGRDIGAWFSSASGFGYANGIWTSDATRMVERAKTDGEMASGMIAYGTLGQVIVYPHPLTTGEGRMKCFETFLNAMGDPA